MIKARGGTLLWTGDAKAVALGREAGNVWDYHRAGVLPVRRGLHRYDDFIDTKTAATAPHQWLR